MQEELLTAEDVAKLLKVSVHTLASWRREKKPDVLPWIVVGASIRYRPEDVQKWLDSRTLGGTLA
jgi:predicted site-specific integrase-resolvase